MANYRSILLISVMIVAFSVLEWQRRGGPDNAADGVTRLSWATSSVGSAGHRAKVALMSVLSRELPDFSIDVMPTSGALASMRGFALGQFDGFYGADIAFRELAADADRFAGFRPHVVHEPLQSFWAYTLEVGLAVRRPDAQTFSGWRDLEGRVLFTGPAAWDVRAHMDLGLRTLGVQFRYRELDPGLAGGMLASGGVDAFVAYTAGGRAPAAWVSEALISSDAVVLNPSLDEIADLHAAGMQTIELDALVFRTDVGAEKVVLLPFHYGFHVGMNVSTEDVYRMLLAIERNLDELVAADRVFTQLQQDMPGVQRRGIIATGMAARIHPGLARYLQTRDAWNQDWDERVAGGPQ